MPQIIITCPHCGFSRQLDQSVIPPGTTQATCPQCKEGFALASDMMPLPAPSPVPPPEPSAAVAEAVSAQAAPEEKSPQSLRFQFTGTAREYFGIWIVNTFLKIITLGIYTAWAKVRKRRYFYGSTQLHSASFEYLADPMALFKGWLVAVLFFLLYSLGSKVSPALSVVFSILFFVLVPWLVVRSRIFNQRNSAHRNIRFNFTPNYREAYVAFAGLPILLPFSFGLLFPYMIYCQKRFFVENTAYGSTGCTFDATAKDFYRVFIRAAGWMLLLIVLLVFGGLLLSSTLREFAPLFHELGKPDVGGMGQKIVVLMTIVFLAVIPVFYLFFAVYVQTALTNLTWNGTRIGNNRFVSTLRVRDMAWLYLSNAVAIFISLGLLIPWVSVRMARYRFDNLALNFMDDPEQFIAAGHDNVNAAGEEIGDMFGIDVAL